MKDHMTGGFESAARDGRSDDAAGLVARAETQEIRIDELQKVVGQLEHALRARVVIDRAIGMLAERFDLPIADAFELLRSAARDTGQEVRVLATETTQSRGWTPDEIVAARLRHPPARG